jgi:hypothetical protein
MITSQSGSSIVTQSSGSYRCAVTGTNSAGSVTQTSAPRTVSPTSTPTPTPTPIPNPNPTPSPTPAALRGLTVTKQSVRLTVNGAAPIKVSCPAATHAKCTGKLKLTTKTKSKSKSGQRTTTTITLGTTSFTVAAGKHTTLDVKLTNAAQVRVEQTTKLTAAATATPRNGVKRTQTTVATITIRPHRAHADG